MVARPPVVAHRGKAPRAGRHDARCRTESPTRVGSSGTKKMTTDCHKQPQLCLPAMQRSTSVVLRSCLLTSVGCLFVGTMATAGGCDSQTRDGDAGAVDIADPLSAEDVESVFRNAQTVEDLFEALPPEALPPELLDLDPELPLSFVEPGTASRAGPPEVASTTLAAPNSPQLLAEDACATQALSAPNGDDVDYFSPTQPRRTSPDTSYGTTVCPDQFVVEITNTYSRPLEFIARSPANTPSYCENLTIDATAYGYGPKVISISPLVISLGWTNVGSTTLEGTWSAGCEFTTGPGASPLPSYSSTLFSIVRVAARATSSGIGGAVKRRVEAGLAHFNIQ